MEITSVRTYVANKGEGDEEKTGTGRIGRNL
jgi:hypothetical protein